MDTLDRLSNPDTEQRLNRAAALEELARIATGEIPIPTLETEETQHTIEPPKGPKTITMSPADARAIAEEYGGGYFGRSSRR